MVHDPSIASVLDFASLDSTYALPASNKKARACGPRRCETGNWSLTPIFLFGDFLFAKETEHGRGALATLLGPVVGLTEEALALTWGNLLEASEGEETDAGAEAIKFAKGNTPVVSALLNLWYTRVIADHLLVHDLQEAANPGYLRRMENRAQNEFGQDYWWRPGEVMLERAPELEAAINERR